MCSVIFFFKQKTAYEMRISDWSSDVCSSDLNDLPGMAKRLGPRIHFAHLRNIKRETQGILCSFHEDEHLAGDTDMVAVIAALLREEQMRQRKIGRASCRERVCQYV